MRKNFSKSVKLFDIAGQDGLRPAMQCIKFEGGCAYATDGHMLIKATLQDITAFEPEELAILEGKCISADSLKRIYQHDVVEVTRDGIVAEDKTLGCKVTYTWANEETTKNFPTTKPNNSQSGRTKTILKNDSRKSIQRNRWLRGCCGYARMGECLPLRDQPLRARSPCGRGIPRLTDCTIICDNSTKPQ